MARPDEPPSRIVRRAPASVDDPYRVEMTPQAAASLAEARELAERGLKSLRAQLWQKLTCGNVEAALESAIGIINRIDALERIVATAKGVTR